MDKICVAAGPAFILKLSIMLMCVWNAEQLINPIRMTCLFYPFDVSAFTFQSLSKTFLCRVDWKCTRCALPNSRHTNHRLIICIQLAWNLILNNLVVSNFKKCLTEMKIVWYADRKVSNFRKSALMQAVMSSELFSASDLLGLCNCLYSFKALSTARVDK